MLLPDGTTLNLATTIPLKSNIDEEVLKIGICINPLFPAASFPVKAIAEKLTTHRNYRIAQLEAKGENPDFLDLDIRLLMQGALGELFVRAFSINTYTYKSTSFPNVRIFNWFL